MNLDIYGDNISYVTDEVSTIKTCEANLNEDNRAKFVTDLAAISRGKHESNNPKARYSKLLFEAAPTSETVREFKNNIIDKIVKSPSRPLEFLPVKMLLVENGVYEVFDMKGNYLWEFASICEVQMLLKYSYLTYLPFGKENGYPDKLSDKIAYVLHTNMRALINAGVPYEKIPYNTAEDLKEFKALKANIPMFVWAQVPNTHTAISKEAQSDRVAENEKYWLPEDFRYRVFELTKDGTYEGEPIDHLYSLPSGKTLGIAQQEILLHGDKITEGLLKLTQEDAKDLFKVLGYPQEIYSRAMYYFKYKEVVMTGWNSDPKVWQHLFLERNACKDIYKNWTQSETEKFVVKIKEIIDSH